jgi:hypothetical protein
MGGFPGPTAGLKARHRRSGRSGTVWSEGKMLGEVSSIEWSVEVEQIAVPIPGSFQDGLKPGAEARRGTMRLDDVDDHWRRYVWFWLDARRRGDAETAAEFPTFNIITQIADIGTPGGAKTRWALRDCQLFSYSGGFSQQDQYLQRDVAFSFESDGPIDSFEYAEGGIVTFQG